MSKQLLEDKLTGLKEGAYSWNLYFINVNGRKRGSNPFKVSKVRFKKDANLASYVSHLISVVKKYQVEPLMEVMDYNGENTKVSCDKMDVTDVKICNQWDKLIEAVSNATDKSIEGKVHGYLVEGQLTNENGETETITFFKFSNPIIGIKQNKTVTFTEVEEELDVLADSVYRLYLTTDMILLSGKLYTFNHAFESILGLEKTMDKAKKIAIDGIVEIDCFSNKEKFRTMAQRCNCARTLISLDEERVRKLNTPQGAKDISEILGIKLNKKGRFQELTKEETSLLLRYLCRKIIRDDENKDLYRVNNAVKETIKV